MFVDRVKIEVRAGKGGNGAVSLEERSLSPKVDLMEAMEERVEI